MTEEATNLSAVVEKLRGLAEHNRQHFPITAEPGYYALGDEAADLIEQLQAEKARLAEDLNALAQAEATYRYAHDILGAGHPKTGRAWDLMKRAGDKARANPSSPSGISREDEG